MNDTKKLKNSPASHGKSKIFQPFRAVGYIVAPVPMACQSRGGRLFFVASVGRAYQVYNDQLRLCFLSQQLPSDIEHMVAVGDKVYASTENGEVFVFKRAKLVGKLEDCQSPVIDILEFGGLLVSCHRDSHVRVWSCATDELESQWMLPQDFHCTTVAHPSTYVNKVLVGGRGGRMLLWNLKSHKMLFEYQLEDADVTCIEQSPVIDVVGVGQSNGRVTLLNLRQDEVLMRFQMDQAVSRISFRTDGPPWMLTSAINGDIAVWNLDEQRLTRMFSAHDRSVHTLHFVAGLPMLVTSGGDNAIRMWIFDQLDGGQRLLRQRSGHYLPVQQLQYYGDQDGKFLLSSAADRTLRLFNTQRDEQGVIMSQGADMVKKALARKLEVIDLQLPPAVMIAASSTKQKDWDCVLTCHEKLPTAVMWSFERKAISEKRIAAPDGSVVTSVWVSACGNFGAFGCQSGLVYAVNMQSGIVRRKYEGHTADATGLAMDAVNSKIVSVSLDGKLNVWHFHTGQQIISVGNDAPLTKLTIQLDSDLVAFCDESYVIKVFDLDTLKTVRVFSGHRDIVTAIAFSSDSRWLISSSRDCTVRTWDIASGHLVDIFKCQEPIVSMSFSPTADFLATAHEGQVGVYMWANRFKFTNVMLGPVNLMDNDLDIVELPGISGNGDATLEMDTLNVADDYFVYMSPQQLCDSMLTLSVTTKSKWQNLLSLDVIKKRNKPKVSPKIPESAPFFLPLANGIKPQFEVGATTIDDQTESRLTKFTEFDEQSDFIQLVVEAAGSDDIEQLEQRLLAMSPSAIDMEIRSLNVIDGVGALGSLLQCILMLVKTGRNYEIYQALLALTLKIHGDVIVTAGGQLVEMLDLLVAAQQEAIKCIDPLFKKAQSHLEFIRAGQ